MSDFLKEFLFNFVDNIPHSIFDETFKVFDLLLSLVKNILDEALIEVSTFFNFIFVIFTSLCTKYNAIHLS